MTSKLDDEKKLVSIIRYNLESIASNYIVIDNRDLITRTLKRTIGRDTEDIVRYRIMSQIVRTSIRNFCHDGVFGLFYKYTKKYKKTLLVYHKKAWNSIIMRASDLLIHLNKQGEIGEGNRIDNRILDILIYMGEVVLEGGRILSVGSIFEDSSQL